jgi:hypothetical protein
MNQIQQKVLISFKQLSLDVSSLDVSSLDVSSVEIEWNHFKHTLLQSAQDVCGKRYIPENTL